jgi:hypothetical protein
MQGAEQWPTVTEEHLKFLRKLQEEQYDGYQYFLAVSFVKCLNTYLLVLTNFIVAEWQRIRRAAVFSAFLSTASACST